VNALACSLTIFGETPAAKARVAAEWRRSLERVRHTYGLRVSGYVVMPEHVHLQRSEPNRDTLAVAIKFLKQEVSRRLIKAAYISGKSAITISKTEITISSSRSCSVFIATW
jgi:REP element-mobilizing transposase RayT